MMNATAERRPNLEELMVQARDLLSETLARMFRSLFTAPSRAGETVFAKCHLERLRDDRPLLTRKRDGFAANPLIIRGLQVG